jgi:hypothetical protein
VAAGPLVKKLSCCTLLQVFKSSNVSECDKTSLMCFRSTNEFFSEPLLRKKRREKTVAVRLAQEKTYSVIT